MEKTVVLADSHRPRLEGISAYFRRVGLDVECTAGGCQCLSILRWKVPGALVLSDELLWGGSDGILSVIGVHPRLSEVPVIMLGRGVGKWDFPQIVVWFSEPFELGSLVKYVSQLLGSHSTGSAVFDHRASRAVHGSHTLRRDHVDSINVIDGR